MKILIDHFKKSINPNITYAEENEYLFLMLNTIQDKLTNEIHNTPNSYRITVFLWDNTPLIEYFKILLQSQRRSYREKVNKIVETIQNHVAKFHIITHSIVHNKFEFKSLANYSLRMSVIEHKNVI